MYYTVKTGKLVNEAEDTAWRRAIDACVFLTPETERDIDLALGIGTEVTKPLIEEVDTVFGKEDEVEDIIDAAGPSRAALAEIEAEIEAE